MNNTWYYVTEWCVWWCWCSNSVKNCMWTGSLKVLDDDLTGNINSYNSLRLNIRQAPSGYRLFAGELNGYRIYKRALSQQEIRTQMFSAVTVHAASLVSYWDFNQSSGANITDKGSMNLNTTFYSSCWCSWYYFLLPVYCMYDNDKDWAVNGWLVNRLLQ